MVDWCHIPTEAFVREWADVQTTVFGPRVGRAWGGDRPFADPSWRIIPMPYAPTQSEPGNGEDDWEDPDDPVQFPPNVPRFEYFYDPLFALVAEQGAGPVMMTTENTYSPCAIFRHEQNGEVTLWEKEFSTLIHRPCLESLKEAAEDWFLGRVFTMFDRTAGWGLLCDDDQLFLSFLGGPSDFIDAFCDRCGGEENVRAWFAFGHLHGHLSPREPETHPDDPDRKILEHCYRMAGWKYPRQWNKFYGATVDWPWVLGWTDEKSDA